jgi:hypothetical protein
MGWPDLRSNGPLQPFHNAHVQPPNWVYIRHVPLNAGMELLQQLLLSADPLLWSHPE